MASNYFNFANAGWLWGLIILPLFWLIFYFRNSKTMKKFNLERFADRHLLPFLVKENGPQKSSITKSLTFWSVIWACAVLAMANPRWDFNEINTFKTNRNLVLLLDLSKSMDLTDLKPSRLIRAKEKIQDILSENPDFNIGLVAFSSDPHMITPVTEDKHAIQYLLSSLRTDLVPDNESRLGPALVMADQMLSAVPGNSKNILVLSDGNFGDASSLGIVKELRSHGLRVSAIGMSPSTQKQDQMRAIAKLGDGKYFNGTENLNLLSESYTGATGNLETASQKIIEWEPRFYIFIIPLMIMLLPLFRRRKFGLAKRASSGLAASVLLALFIFSNHAQAAEGATTNEPLKLSTLFKNRATLGKEALEAKDYDTARSQFDDAYRKGVVEYRAGQYDKAEENFKKAKRQEVKIDAKYNLGNALALQGKYEDAINAYQDVLKEKPNHEDAKINLKIVEDLMKKKNENKKDEAKSDGGQGKDKNSNSKQGQGEKSTAKSAENKDQGKKNDKDQNGGGDSAQKEEKKSIASNSQQGEGEGEKKSTVKPQSAPEAQNAQNMKPKSQQDQKAEQKADLHSDSTQYDQKTAKKYQKDIDADQWLDRINSDPHEFLKNQFLIESARLHSQKGESL